jgi:hypothetical protein
MECRQIKDQVRAGKQSLKLGRANENERFQNSRQTPWAFEKTTSNQAEKTSTPGIIRSPIQTGEIRVRIGDRACKPVAKEENYPKQA